MRIPTTSQYKSAIAQLSDRYIRILQVLYHFPNSSATAPQLAEALNYRGFQGANRHIGAIGQAIYEHTGVEIPTYTDRGKVRPSYYYFVGAYYENGWEMWPQLQKALEELNLVSEPVSKKPYTDRLPTEIRVFEESKLYKEGKITEVFVNRYERNQQARLACLKHFGATCQGCGFNFEESYGAEFRGFIHVHHLIELHTIRKAYEVNPVKDLIPLCPNCHSVVHLTTPAMSLVDLKDTVRRRMRKQSIIQK